jgi:hypothetical protein
VSAEHTPYLNLIGRRYPKDDPEQLRLAHGKVQAMLASEGWQILQEILAEAHARSTKNLILGQSAIQGAVPSQAEYARAVGFLAGVEQPQVAAESFDLALVAMRRSLESPE